MPPTLVCFAVKEEAAPFRKLAAGRTDISVLITGMGRGNAERTVRAALEDIRPNALITAGFAGGLRPGLALGTVLVGDDSDPGLTQRLVAAGARKATIFCSERVASTAAQKHQLHQQTGADAVEMESGSICALCRSAGIPSATVRVVLDTAEEDLPLDFNSLMTPEQKLSAGKLALALAKSPGKIGGLLRLQKQSAESAQKLAAVLGRALSLGVI